MSRDEVSRRAVLKRGYEVASILMKYGFPVADLFPGRHLHLPQRKQKAGDSNLSVDRRIRLAIQELGPTFIKFGQIMSTRPDLVSPELCTELKALTDDVKAVPWEAIEPTIKELCGDIDKTFVFLNKRPLAAASLSQVYLGRLRDGRVTILKVQRPGIEDSIKTDLHILKYIAKKAKLPELRLFNFPGAVEEFSHQILSELDFEKDGRNADLLARNMREVEGIRVPKIYWEYTGHRLLAMEYIKGVRIDRLEQIKKMKVDPKKIALLGLQAYWKQIFDDGFFHGDPHPGNLLVTPQSELVFLDFGLFGAVRPEKRDALLSMFLGLVEKKVDMIIDALSLFGLTVEDSKVDAFKDDIYLVLVENESKTIEPDVSLLNDLVEVLNKYGLVIPTDVMLMVKVFGMVQDLCSKLYPGFILLEQVKPMLSTSLRRKILKKANIREVGLSTLEKLGSLKEFPKNINATLKQLSKGSFTLKIEDHDLERLERIADRTSYRILLGLVAASIVVGMSLVLFTARNLLGVQSAGVAVLVYAIAVLIVFFSMIELMRARDKQ